MTDAPVMMPARFLTILIASLALGGCSLQWPSLAEAPSPVPETTSSVATSRLAMPPAVARNAAGDSSQAYRLDSGDRVRVVVAGADALSNSYAVDAGGAIELPSIGKLNARGLSTVQLSAAIARRLKQGKTREAHVAVQIETYRPISIRGDVANPGQYPYVNNMTTETAIEMAGGLKPGADKTAVTVSGGAQGSRRASTLSPVQPGETVTVTEDR